MKKPEKKDETEMTYGGINPDRNRGYNDACDEWEEWILMNKDDPEHPEYMDPYLRDGENQNYN